MRKLVVVLVVLVVFAGACGTDQADHRVLFVGNSYTRGNDLPKMVAEIADANGSSIDYEMIVSDGATLTDHAVDGDVVRALRDGEFDVVVLQEQSVRPAVEFWLESETLPAAHALGQYAADGGTRIVWFQTWGRRDGLPGDGFATFDDMQEALTAGYLELAWEVGGDVAPAGQRWQRLLRAGAPAPLHGGDGSHATPAGTYAAAIEIAWTIIESPILDAPAVDGVDERTAELLLGG